MTGKALESACKAHEHRTRHRTLLRIDALCGRALALPWGGEEFRAIVAEVVELEKSLEFSGDDP